jgi:RHS repeat-associated protein
MPYRTIGQGVPVAIVFLHQDHLGSLRHVSDTNGAQKELHKYLPYGEEAQVTTTSSPFRYAGYEFDDEARMHYVGARYYQAGRARWLTPDPLGAGFRYVGNSPVSFYDPTGLLTCQQGPTRPGDPPLPCIEDPIRVFATQPPPTHYAGGRFFPPATQFPNPPSLPNLNVWTAAEPVVKKALKDKVCPPVPLLPPGASISRNVTITSALSHLEGGTATWIGLVFNHSVWDYNELGIQFDDAGNFNYGATGQAIGFDLSTLLWAAGVAQAAFPSGGPGIGQPGLIPGTGRGLFGDHGGDATPIIMGYVYAANGCP